MCFIYLVECRQETPPFLDQSPSDEPIRLNNGIKMSLTIATSINGYSLIPHIVAWLTPVNQHQGTVNLR